VGLRASGTLERNPVEVGPVDGNGSLLGRIAVVTGVSRRAGIGFAIAQRLLADGASVVVHSWSAHDGDQPWGADPGGIDAVLAALGGVGGRLRHFEADLADPKAPQWLIDYALGEFGAVDVLVANHARSSEGGLGDVTAEELDRSWAVNARAVVLLAQAYAAAHDDRRLHGRIVLFTSGQHIDPMGGELAYAISKGAVHQMTRSIADELADRAITVNTINPGPVDTGWASPELLERFAGAFPAGRWGRPADIAGVVRVLIDDDSGWVTGQIINAEGGYRRSPLGPETS
jgi:3-oxoacyl-[acyl-carrier protein] reductase